MELYPSSNSLTDKEISLFVEERQSSIPSEKLKLPIIYKRNILDRIFVNRDLRLDRIQWVGFDMDYTLAVYNSPEYESLSFDLIINRLVKMGYPPSIKQLKYDPEFPIRGLLFDTILGHLLKVDNFGNILHCLKGRTALNKRKISEIYQTFNIPSEEIGKRYWPLPTLFNLPEACLYADLIDFFLQHPDVLELSEHRGEELLESYRKFEDNTSDVKKETPKLSFVNLFQDIRLAMDHVHQQGELKEKTLENIERYIKRTPKTSLLLDRIRKAGMKLLLLTNSDYLYTNRVMSYLLNGQNSDYANWRDYFDVIIVSAGKPTFFNQGTTLREVSCESGNLKIGAITKFCKGCVYQGGSIALFNSLSGAKGNEVLYIGDHIYADIIKSKKTHAWRNMLIIPELEHEILVWVRFPSSS